MATAFAASGNLVRLQGVWLYRMILSPHPLRERMTLFWHNHFATSNAKVNNPGLMQRQNDLFRQQALGDFRALLTRDGQRSGDARLARFDRPIAGRSRTRTTPAK